MNPTPIQLSYVVQQYSSEQRSEECDFLARNLFLSIRYWIEL